MSSIWIDYDPPTSASRSGGTPTPRAADHRPVPGGDLSRHRRARPAAAEAATTVTAHARNALAEVPRPVAVAHEVRRQRLAIRQVLDGADDRLLVILGPQAITDTDALLAYARQLAQACVPYTRHLLVALQVAARSLHDLLGPAGTRRLLLDAAAVGLPLATRYDDLAVAVATADLFAHAVVVAEARRLLVPSLPMPVGCANDTDDVPAAVDAAVQDLRRGRSRDDQAPGAAPHFVLRPSTPEAPPVRATLARLQAVGLGSRLLVDLSPLTARGGDRGQVQGAWAVARLLRAGQRGLVGVLAASSLHGGDGCLSLPNTVALLDSLAIAVERRRMGPGSSGPLR